MGSFPGLAPSAAKWGMAVFEEDFRRLHQSATEYPFILVNIDSVAFFRQELLPYDVVVPIIVEMNWNAGFQTFCLSERWASLKRFRSEIRSSFVGGNPLIAGFGSPDSSPTLLLRTLERFSTSSFFRYSSDRGSAPPKIRA